MKQPADYRPDIDGLRAVAVLSVLIFHYSATWMPGGFVGVDVFFVISGYLITKGLAEDIAHNGHSIGPLLIRFYNRRIRRIVPALIVVLAATLAAAWFLLMPGDYATTGHSAAYSAFGLGNLYFYWNTGYFDREAELQPLLHMWSLGVEEQFYLVWPILLAGILWLTGGRRNPTLAVIFALVVAGFAVAVYAAGADPKIAFYLPLPRAWELGVGAAVAFAPRIDWKWAVNLMGAVGLVLIGWSALTTTGGASPGWPMVPTVAGSALLVWPRVASLPSQLLSVAPMRFVGLISYSLYLWHWPVLVLFRFYANGDAPTSAEAIALAAVSIGLATLSWRYVETPARTVKFPSSAAIATGLGSAAAVAGMGAWIVYTNGFYDRLPKQAKAMSSLEVMWEWECPYTTVKRDLGTKRPFCVIGAPWETAKRRAIIWGDSHAGHLTPLVQSASSNQVSYLLYNPCPAALGKTVRRVNQDSPDYVKRCEGQRQLLLNALHDDPSIEALVLTASWGPLAGVVERSDGKAFKSGPELLREGLAEFLSEVPSTVRVVLVGQVPFPGKDPVPCEVGSEANLLRRKCDDLGRSIFASTRKRVEPVNIAFERLKPAFPGMTLLLPSRRMCDDGTCVTQIDGLPLFRDGSHIRRNLPDQVLHKIADMIGLSEAIASIEQSDASIATGQR